MKKTKNKKVKYGNRSAPKLIPGTLFIHPKKGFGFVTPEDPEDYPFDIFIAAKDLKGALDGDLVIVAVHPRSYFGNRCHGVIHAVTARGKSLIVGIIVSMISENTAWVTASALNPEARFKACLLPNKTYQIGDRILFSTPPWNADGLSSEPPPLQMISHIGNIEDATSDFFTIQAEFALDETFPEDAIKESARFSQQHITRAAHSRTDLRDLLCFTIDSATAKDFDDAVSLTYDHEENCILGVHIADVSHYVVPNSALDKEAARRCNSTYFPNKVIPMLPSVLSDDLCSLKPEVDRLAVSVFMTFSKEGFLTNYQIHRSIIRSKYRMTYDEVDAILKKKKKHPLTSNLTAMHSLSKKFSKLREERGCIPLSLSSLSISLDQNEEPIDLIEIKQTAAHKLIEEFMLKANEVVAYHLAHQGIALPFRIHEEPNADSLLTFQETAKAMGFSIPTTPNHEPDYRHLLENIPDSHPLKTILHSQFVRSMKTASYSTENKGHYGLQLDYYTHFTSPIRRYIDLVIHRLLFHPMAINPKHLENVVRQCSSQERISAKAENALENMKKSRFLARLLKESPETSYTAYIVTPSTEGLSFVIPALCLEGFISQAQLPKGLILTQKTAYEDLPPKLRPGAPLKVKIKTVNLFNQTVEWSLVISKDKQEKRVATTKRSKPTSKTSHKSPSKRKKFKTVSKNTKAK